MNILQAVFLGSIQGLTEFIPVSSSAHLIVLPWLFHWQEHPLAFDVMLHAGTFFAAVIYFRKYWTGILVNGLSAIARRQARSSFEARLFWFIAIATVPGAVAGKILQAKAETAFRSALPVAFALAVFAVIFFVIERLSRKKRSLAEFNWTDAVLIGLSQALAIVPGVSRSGITIICGLALGFNRESAARFSFLLSAPIILGATLLEAKHISWLMDSPAFVSLLGGFLSALVVGFSAIHCLLTYIKRHSFNLFIVYRIILGLTVAAVFFLRRI